MQGAEVIGKGRKHSEMGDKNISNQQLVTKTQGGRYGEQGAEAWRTEGHPTKKAVSAPKRFQRNFL